MKSLTGGICFACMGLALGGIGCGATPDEMVGSVQSAVTIGSWNDLVTKLGTSGTYNLTGNIVATGKTWTPKDFTGTFDGGNFTISGLTINNGSFFNSLTNATVKNLKLTGENITGNANKATFGGLAGSATDSTIQNCAVEVNIKMTAAVAGGIVGAMYGGSIYRSYAKGSVIGNIANSGGLVGFSSLGTNRTTITESYAQMTIGPDPAIATSGGRAGGLVGYGYAVDIHDAYAVGDVTGRGAVGGIIGDVQCSDGDSFLVYKTIYRGNVVDKDRPGGWAGIVGPFDTATLAICASRFTQNFYNNQLDNSGPKAATPSASANQGYSTSQLQTPTSVIGGVFCAEDIIPGRCGDNTWASPPWTAGTSSQYHGLLNMPGPNAQPRTTP